MTIPSIARVAAHPATRALAMGATGLAAAEVSMNRTSTLTEQALIRLMLADQNEVVAEGDGFVLERTRPDLTGPATSALTVAGAGVATGGVWTLGRAFAAAPGGWAAGSMRLAIPGAALLGAGAGAIAGSRIVAANLAGATVHRLDR